MMKKNVCFQGPLRQNLQVHHCITCMPIAFAMEYSQGHSWTQHDKCIRLTNILLAMQLYQAGQLFSVGLPMPYPVRVTQQWSVNRWGLEVDGQVCEVWVMVVLVTAAGSQSQHTGLISLFFPRLGKGDISWHLYFQSMSF